MRLTKVAENRLRRVAKRQGYQLHRSRARDPRSNSFDRYRLEGHFSYLSEDGKWSDVTEVALLLREPLFEEDYRA